MTMPELTVREFTAGLGLNPSTDKGNVIEALNEGAVAYLQKPVDPRELFYTVRHWVDFSRMKEGSGQDQHYRAMCDILKENAASYRQLIEHLPAAVVVHDRCGKILYANPAAAGMLRAADASALMGRHVLEFVQPESLAAVKELKQQVEAGRPCSLEKLHFLRCDGTPFLTEMKAVPCRFEQQQAVQVVLLDITERSLAEEAAKASEARLEEAQTIARVGNWEWNTQSNEVFFSAEACRIFGFDRELAEVQFQAVFDLIHPDDQGRVRQMIDAMLQHHSPLDIEHRILLTGDEERIVNERGIAHPDDEGQVVRVTGTVQDVTEQRRYEVTLQEQLARNEQILQTTQDGFWMVSRDGRLVEVNDTYCRLSGYSREELLTMNFADVEASESPDEMATHMATVLERGYDCFETRHRCKDGSLIDLEISVSVIDKGGKKYFASFLRDISERSTQEKQLREHLKQHELIVQTTRDGFWIVSLAGRLLEVNDTYCRMIGYARQELLDMNIGHLEADENPDEVKAHIGRVMEKGYDCFETRHRCKDGSLIDVEISVSLIEQEKEKLLVAFLRDISERKKAESALQDSKAQLQSLIEQAPDGIFIPKSDKGVERRPFSVLNGSRSSVFLLS